MKLMINALLKFGVGSGFTAALLFFSAGTLHWMNGWIWSLLIFLTYPLIITKRIRNEEKVLKEELEGYEAYCKKVRYRLIPGIW